MWAGERIVHAKEWDCTVLALGNRWNRDRSHTKQPVLFSHQLHVRIIKRTCWSDKIYVKRKNLALSEHERKKEGTSLLCRWEAVDDIVPLSRFSLSYLTNTNFMSLVDLSPIFAFSNVNTKNRALSRPSHEPFSIQWMVPSLSPYFVCPRWNYHSLQPGTNPWGLSFTQHNFFARTGHGVLFSLEQISHWGPWVSCLEVAGQTSQCLSWGLQPLGRKLPSFCFSFPSVKDIFGIGWFSNEMH